MGLNTQISDHKHHQKEQQQQLTTIGADASAIIGLGQSTEIITFIPYIYPLSL
jgi:hypothetical protein